MRFFGLFGLDCHRNIRYHRKGVELFWIVYRLNCFCWSVVFSLDIIHYSQNRSLWKARTFYQTFKLSWKRLNDINRLLLSNFFFRLTGLRHIKKNVSYMQCFKHCTPQLCRPSLYSSWTKHLCRPQLGVARTLLARNR